MSRGLVIKTHFHLHKHNIVEQYPYCSSVVSCTDVEPLLKISSSFIITNAETQTWTVVTGLGALLQRQRGWIWRLLSTHHCWFQHVSAAPYIYTTVPGDVLHTFSFLFTCNLGDAVAQWYRVTRKSSVGSWSQHIRHQTLSSLTTGMKERLQRFSAKSSVNTLIYKSAECQLLPQRTRLTVSYITVVQRYQN